MSTRSSIAIENSDGTIEAIYCHWDGYPSFNGRLLLEHYGTEAGVRELLAPGDLSSLAKNVGEKHGFDNRDDDACTYYGRDRGESGTDKKTYPDRATWLKKLGQEYNYLFVPGQGWLINVSGLSFSPLSEHGDLTE